MHSPSAHESPNPRQGVLSATKVLAAYPLIDAYNTYNHHGELTREQYLLLSANRAQVHKEHMAALMKAEKIQTTSYRLELGAMKTSIPLMIGATATALTAMLTDTFGSFQEDIVAYEAGGTGSIAFVCGSLYAASKLYDRHHKIRKPKLSRWW